ncbi:MAG: homogentisate 1,2-dioxygenase [Gammaproteobacteria bacterium]|nr:homogentisate 1,2-dioxygenase [Gammaproteobacteria bacterium]
MAHDYLAGFGNEFESEAVAGALPRGQFSPQRAPHGLYAEKFSLTAFTAPRADNRRTWFYRIRPSVTQGGYTPLATPNWSSAPLVGGMTPPDPLRWSPPPLAAGRDFADGLVTIAANGDAATQAGIGIHLYRADQPMTRRCLVDADGELLLVPWSGAITLTTECGELDVAPGEIAIVPRGMKFAVDPHGGAAGYVCENYGAALRLPERGPVGSDGFANNRDFLAPVAAYRDADTPFEIVCRFQGHSFRADIDHDPFDVVAWVGTAVPCKYDLRRFNVMGSISYDHPDPSIFTVLSAPSDTPGVANVDFVIFPPRWLVAEHSFRPPWFHRNVMSEFMGLVYGQYDAKQSGFEPGGMSLHNAFVPHGPDADVYAAASSAPLAPAKLDDTLAFMFETRYPLRLTRWALESPALQDDYRACWQGLRRHFTPPA